MAGWIALSLIAAQLAAAPVGPTAPAGSPTRVSAPAQAFVRILPGAKVSLSGQAEAQGYRLSNATVTTEDGSRRPAKLVEFQ